MERETGIEPATSSLGIVYEILIPLSLKRYDSAESSKPPQQSCISARQAHPSFPSFVDCYLRRKPSVSTAYSSFRLSDLTGQSLPIFRVW